MLYSFNKLVVMRALTFLFTALLLCGAFVFSPNSLAQDKIMTWGSDTPEWSSKLGVSAIRFGCSSVPQSCLRDSAAAESHQHVQTIFLSVLLKEPQGLSYATQYGALSSSRPDIVEVSYDDFLGQVDKLGMDPNALNAYLAQIDHALKQGNSHLKLGITLYENEIDSQLPRLSLRSDFYNSVDFVHLYPHYRKTAAPFADYVKKVKSLFPNAQIIAGVYAYDRLDYLPCSKASNDHCSNEQQLSLFKDMLQQELSLLRSGQVSWLEFFPGFFGAEEGWRGWSEPRICSASRRQECVDNTKALRQAALQILGGH